MLERKEAYRLATKWSCTTQSTRKNGDVCVLRQGIRPSFPNKDSAFARLPRIFLPDYLDFQNFLIVPEVYGRICRAHLANLGVGSIWFRIIGKRRRSNQIKYFLATVSDGLGLEFICYYPL